MRKRGAKSGPRVRARRVYANAANRTADSVSKARMMKAKDETTYAWVSATQKEERGRDAFEVAVYAGYVATVVVAIGQFALVAKPLLHALRTAHHHHTHKGHSIEGTRPS